MRSADSDSQAVNARALYELLYLFGSRVASVLCADVDGVLYTCESAELTLYGNAVVVSVLYYLLGKSDIVLERVVRTVYHNGSESAVDTILTELERIAVI